MYSLGSAESSQGNKQHTCAPDTECQVGDKGPCGATWENFAIGSLVIKTHFGFLKVDSLSHFTDQGSQA